MIATVTLNPAMDWTMAIPGFGAGRTNRGAVERVDAGGKGVNVAMAIRQWGCPVIALGFRAGMGGASITRALADLDIAFDFLEVPGETRVNLKIMDPDTGAETEINQLGFRVDAGHLEGLARQIADYAGRCSVMVFSGSLPPGAPADTYARLVRIARERGAQVVLDTSGEALRIGLPACPEWIKPNQAEVEELLGTRLSRDAQLAEAARRMLRAGPGQVLISLGAGGALAAAADRLWRATSPQIQLRSSIGAGDAMVAALAYSITKQFSLPEALRLAVASGSATAAQSGSSVATLDVVQELLPRVVVEELHEERVGGG